MKLPVSGRTRRNIILSVGASMAAKLLALVQSAVIAAVFGATGETDVIFYMMGVLVLFTTFSTALNQHVLIPTYITLREKGAPGEASGFLSLVFALYFGVALVLAVTFFLLGPWLIALLTGFGAEVIAANVPVIRTMALVLLVAVLNTFLFDVFTAFRVFILPMVNDVLKNLLIIGFVLLAGTQAGVAHIAGAMLAATLLQLATMLLALFFRLGLRPARPAWPKRRGGPLQRNIGFVLVAQGVSMLEALLVMGIMTGFSDGTYISMELANKISTTIYNVLVVQTVTVVGIELLEHNARENRARLAKVFSGYLRLALYLVVPLAAIVSVNATSVVGLMFGYGKYTAQDVQICAATLSVAVLGLPLRMGDAFLQKLIVAKQLHSRTFLFQVVQSGLSVGLSLALSRAIGFIGLPLAQILCSFVYILLLVLVVQRRQFPEIDMAGILRFFALNALCAGAGALAGLGLRYLLPAWPGRAGTLLTLILCGSAMAGAALLGGLLFAENRQMAGRAWHTLRAKLFRKKERQHC